MNVCSEWAFFFWKCFVGHYPLLYCTQTAICRQNVALKLTAIKPLCLWQKTWLIAVLECIIKYVWNWAIESVTGNMVNNMHLGCIIKPYSLTSCAVIPTLQTKPSLKRQVRERVCSMLIIHDVITHMKGLLLSVMSGIGISHVTFVLG